MNKKTIQNEIDSEVIPPSIQKVIESIEDAIDDFEIIDITGALLFLFPLILSTVAADNPSFANSTKLAMIELLNTIEIEGLH